MTESRVQTLSEKDALDQIVDTVQRAAPGEAPFALVLGAGFSHGLVPTARELVNESLPLWMRSQKDGKPFEPPKHPSLDQRAVACEFWKTFVQRNASRGLVLPLDPQTGLPEDHTAAYRAAFDSRYNGAVGEPAYARKFQRALMRLEKPRLNAAHFLLASLLGAQPGKSHPSSLFKYPAAFCRLILTTNFDPFLQTALQIVNRLYFMSDTPELGVSDEILDDQSDAIHLVYLHGSIHRGLQATAKKTTDQIKEENATTLESCLKRRGVIVLGYSGWDDVVVEALARCAQFNRRLYWCGLEPDPLAKNAFGPRVPEILCKPTAQYVRIDGAGRFMKELLNRLSGKRPRLLANPIGQVRELLEMIDLGELEKPTPPASDVSGMSEPFITGTDTDVFVEAKRSTLERLREAEQLFDGHIAAVLPEETLVLKHPGPTQAEAQTRAAAAARPADSTNKVRQLLTAARLAVHLRIHTEALGLCNEVLGVPGLEGPDKAEAWMVRGTTHYFAGRLDDAVTDWTRVIELPGAPVEWVALALRSRGIAWGEKGETNKALADYTRLIEQLPGAPVEQVAMALNDRGITWREKGETDKALADYTRLIEQFPGAPVDLVAKALANRGWAKYAKDDYCGFLADTEAALSNYPLLVAPAFNLGLALLACRRDPDALDAYRRAGQQFPDKIDALGLRYLAQARTTWLSDERAEPVIQLLQSLKK